MWKIRQFNGGVRDALLSSFFLIFSQAEYTLRANADLIASGTRSVSLPSLYRFYADQKKWNRPPISMDFSIPQLCASGMKIRYIRVTEKNDYDPQRVLFVARSAVFLIHSGFDTSLLLVTIFVVFRNLQSKKLVLLSSFLSTRGGSQGTWRVSK